MSSAKHFIHDPTQLVTSSLQSIPLLNPSVGCDVANKIIYRRRRRRRRRQRDADADADASDHAVSIVSGGGSGHEPSFAGFVGDGLLSAAVTGTIFASPGAEQIRRALTNRVDGANGVLIVVMNYTGDVLNFGLAVEQAKANGLRVEMVVVGDDVGVGRKKAGKVGRRGIAGTVLVHKIAGGLAATGASLEQVCHVAQLVADNLLSLGASLGHVHVPGRTASDSQQEGSDGGDEIEIGMGIHNEPGSQLVKTGLTGLVNTMLSQLLDATDEDRAFLHISHQEDQLVLLVNNLGGVSNLELGGIVTEIVQQLDRHYHIHPVRIISGTYMTSLNGSGFSISLLRMTSTGLGPGKDMLDLLDAPAAAIGWSGSLPPAVWTPGKWEELDDQQDSDTTRVLPQSNLKLDHEQTSRALRAGLERLIAAEPDITLYDTEVGDGDCGTGLCRGAKALLEYLAQGHRLDDAVTVVAQIARLVEGSMDGTSGALYSIFLNALCNSLRMLSPASPTPVSTAIFAGALHSSLASLGKYTPAQPGDRTLIDALHPFVTTLDRTADLDRAAQAATLAAQNTAGMPPRLGRSVYVGGSAWERVPDPGAVAVAALVRGLAEGLGRL